LDFGYPLGFLAQSELTRKRASEFEIKMKTRVKLKLKLIGNENKKARGNQSNGRERIGKKHRAPQTCFGETSRDKNKP
jgi:hypothetical protein